MDGEIGRAAQTKRGDCLHVCERPSVIETPVANRAMLERALHASVFGEFNSGLLDFAVRKQPNDRFIMKIDDLDAVAPRIAKIAAERRLQFQFVFASKFLTNFSQLLLVAYHDSEMSHVCRLHFLHFENGEELVLTEFKKRVALAAVQLLEIKNVFVKRDCFVDVVHLDRDVIASIDLHTHLSA